MRSNRKRAEKLLIEKKELEAMGPAAQSARESMFIKPTPSARKTEGSQLSKVEQMFATDEPMLGTQMAYSQKRDKTDKTNHMV